MQEGAQNKAWKLLIEPDHSQQGCDHCGVKIRSCESELVLGVYARLVFGAIPALTSAARSRRCMLQGLPSYQTEDTPICRYDSYSFSLSDLSHNSGLWH